MTDGAVREAVSFCRICTGGCGVTLRIDAQDRILSIRGDPDNAMTNGYACFKGLASGEAHHGPARLLRPLKRLPDGDYREIGLEAALDEISAKMAEVIHEFGPESVALFCGNGAYTNSTGHAMQAAFLKAIGSTQYFTSMTLDQSAKYVAVGRLGAWGGGFHSLEQMDVLLLFGVNTLLSHSMYGWLSTDPIKRLKAARKNGLKMIVVDPRRSETARQSDLLLQPFPGQDAAIAGGLIRIILDEGWHDRAFCDTYVGSEGLSALRRAVDLLSEDHVAERAGLPPGQLRAAAKMFARDGRRGIAYAATGTNMAPFSNLAQHMVELLNVVCGRFLRAGDPVQRRNMLSRPRSAVARVHPPTRSWEAHGPSRIRGTRLLFGERPSGTLTDEILTPGAGRIRALLVDGGDPMTSFPDQRRTQQAMKDLSLLIAIDPWPSQTTKLADYILPTTMQYERADLPTSTQGPSIWPGGWAQVTAPVIATPPASDVADDWYILWSIAKRLGKPISFRGKPLAMDQAPSTEALLERMLDGAPVSVEELRQYPHGRDYGCDGQVVQPSDDDSRFDVMPDDVQQEMSAFIQSWQPELGFVRDGKTFSHLLSVRRLRDFFNSNGIHVASVRKRNPVNDARLHPDDLARLGIAPGDVIELESAHGTAVAIAGEDADLRSGVITLPHGWGSLPDADADLMTSGTCVNLLIDTDRNFESINAMPHLSAVPVNVRLKTKCTTGE